MADLFEEPTNEDRSERARSVLQDYCNRHGNDENQTTLVDILSDIRHLQADEESELSLADALDTSEMHFEAETEDD